ncbi:MAG: metal ABC transporter permease [Elusimicrobiota bacterium]
MTGFLQFMLLPLCACLLMIMILAYLGMHVLEREIIFIDIALAQIAVVGAIVAMVAFHAEHHTLLANLCAFGATLLAAAFYALAQKGVRGLSIETIIGISYAVAAAAALLFVGLSAEGHAHVHHMLSGSLLWISWKELLYCCAAALPAGGVFLAFRGRFWELSRGHAKSGAKAREGALGWNLLFYALLGVVITAFVRIAGVLVVFSFLIMPATFAAMFSESLGRRWAVACLCGAAASVAGLLFSYYLDFSVGPSVVSFLGAALVAGAAVKRLTAG